MPTLAVTEEKKMLFTEGDYLVKTLEDEAEWRQAHDLRHKVFAERLKWVPERSDRLESDVYDAWSSTIGVFSQQAKILGLVRMTHAPVPFMLESEFSACLVGAHQVRKELDTAEITRLAVDLDIKERGPSTHIMQAAIKGAYQWCLTHDVRYTYIVVEERLFRGLRLMGWPCEAIGKPVALPPAGVVSIAALIDLDEFRYLNGRKRPALLKWFSTVEKVASLPASTPSPHTRRTSSQAMQWAKA
jgi:acyl homoserine lactone synthase